MTDYPIDRSVFEKSVDQMEPESLFNLPMQNYAQLEQSMICYVDVLGSSYLMPCQFQNPA